MSGTVISARAFSVRTALQLAMFFTLTFLLFACNDGTGPALVRHRSRRRSSHARGLASLYWSVRDKSDPHPLDSTDLSAID